MLNEAERLIAGQGPLVYLEGADREAVWKIRTKELDLEQVKVSCDMQFRDLKEQKLQLDLPESLDLAPWSDVLVQIRRLQFEAEQPRAVPWSLSEAGGNAVHLKDAAQNFLNSQVSSFLMSES